MNKSSTPLIFNLEIGDQLTSISCGHIIVELIKFIAYRRLQIPYMYQWLKEVVNKKKASEDENVKDSFRSERHFRIASTALENLDFILKSVRQEMNSPTLPDEVCIALGATPVTFKEVYRVLLPAACHKVQCHSKMIASDQKIQLNVFRTLSTSGQLSQVLFKEIPPTNLYVFMKKKLNNNQDNIVDSDNFVISSGCRIPRSSNIIVIDLRTKVQSNLACCNDFNVFGDIDRDLEKLTINESDEDTDMYHEIESSDDMRWYQSSYVMKGFKDCIINGSSITNSWLKS